MKQDDKELFWEIVPPIVIGLIVSVCIGFLFNYIF